MSEQQDTPWELITEMAPPAANYEFSTLWNEVKNLNQTMRNQMVNLLIAEQETRIAQSRMYPVVGFNAGITDTQSQFRAGELEGEGITLNYFGNFTLNFNLYNGGKTRRALQNAQIREEMARISIDDIASKVQTELANTFYLYNAQKAIFAMTAEHVENQRKALDMAADRFNNGVISSFDYRASQLAYLNAAMQRVESLSNLLSTHTNLVRLSGGLTKSAGV
jgi:outer membrane protein TolC